MDLLSLLLAGAVAGTLAGLLGIGGGTVIVPIVVIVLEAQHVDPEVIIKIAVGTSLATIMVTAISSVYFHNRKGAVDWVIFRTLTPWTLAGTLLGSLIADWMPGRVMYIAFIVFLFAVSISMGIGRIQGSHALPGKLGMASMGLGNGVISAIMGIGGGAINVPFLSYCSVPVKRAIATAASIGLPLATMAAVSYAITGLNEQHIPPASIGYINLPIFAGVVSASILFAPLGAKLAHSLPDKILTRFFAIFLFILACRMAWTLI